MREMKDSGVEWIGEIPETWETVRFKDHYKNKKEIAGEHSSEFERLALTLNGVIKRPKDDSEGLQPKEFDTYQILRENDFVFKMIDLQNISTSRVGLSPYTGLVSPAYIRFTSRKENQFNKFTYYFLMSMYYNCVFNSLGGDGVRSALNASDMGTLMIPNPNLATQQKIAAHLDRKCTRIDALISNAQQQIEKLKAYKQSVITETVTKGLDPDVAMKDSGVEWIGEIPEHWNSIQLKYIISLIESGVSVNAGAESAKENQFGVLKTSSVSKQVFIPTENKNVNEEEYSRVKCPVTHNTLIVSRMNTPDLVGACGYVDRDYPNLFLPDRLWQVHIKNMYVKYVWYYLISHNVRNYYASLASGTSSSMQNISQGQFESLIISVPSLDEQQEISDFLDRKCTQIDKLIDLKQQKIEKLQQYKKSLIYEYVTGKKEV